MDERAALGLGVLIGEGEMGRCLYLAVDNDVGYDAVVVYAGEGCERGYKVWGLEKRHSAS